MTDQTTDFSDEKAGDESAKEAKTASPWVLEAIAKAGRRRKAPEHPQGDRAPRLTPAGFETIGQPSTEIKWLAVLNHQLDQEHREIVDLKDRSDEGRMKHVQNHYDQDVVNEAIDQAILTEFGHDAANSIVVFLADWTLTHRLLPDDLAEEIKSLPMGFRSLIGPRLVAKYMSDDTGDDILDALRRAAERTLPPELRDRVRISVGGDMEGLADMLKEALAEDSSVEIEYAGAMSPERMARISALMGDNTETPEGDESFDSLFGDSLDEILRAMAKSGFDPNAKLAEILGGRGDSELSEGRRNLFELLNAGAMPFEPEEGAEGSPTNLGDTFGNKGPVHAGEGDQVIIERIELGFTINLQLPTPTKKRKKQRKKAKKD
tara:strand:+ start:2162 stop:3292 length:1131 start_codon:yes stop_codon:yes gene_type:complete